MTVVEKVRQGTVMLSWESGLTQIGSSPEHSFSLLALDQETAEWLRRLLTERTLPSHENLSAVQHRLVSLLRSRGLIEGAVSPLADLRVRLIGTDLLGIELAESLIASGVRFLDIRGPGLVDKDVAHLFPTASRGTSRREALIRKLDGPGLYLGKAARPHLAISVENRVINHSRGTQFLHQDIPHLPLIIDDRAVQIGPLLIPGTTACYLCLDHHRTDALPGWPRARVQLESALASEASPALAAGAANIATHFLTAMVQSCSSLLQWNEETAPEADAWFFGLSWRLHERGIDTVKWLPHPRCGCASERLFRAEELTHPARV